MAVYTYQEYFILCAIPNLPTLVNDLSMYLVGMVLYVREETSIIFVLRGYLEMIFVEFHKL